MLFLTEANEKYIDELERFKKEVLICDRDNKDQFAGCMGLRDCSNVKNGSIYVISEKVQRHVNKQERRFRQQPISLSEKATINLSA